MAWRTLEKMMDIEADVCFSSFAPVNERSSQSEEREYGKIKIPQFGHL